MKLLPLEITPSCRTIWVSGQARQQWDPVIKRLSAYVSDLEILSVAKGQRKCAWRSLDETELPAFARKCSEMFLGVMPVRRTGKWEGFAHRTPELKPGQPANVYCIVYHDISHARQFREAFEASDHGGQGEMLGFPKCCRTFFSRQWKQGYVDPVWQWAGMPKNDQVNWSHPYCNPILRYVGLRVGFHIPCGPQCRETVELSNDRLELDRSETGVENAKLLRALLSMSMSWDAYHGQAIVRTPIFQIVTSTMPTAGRHVVNLEGSFCPRESARGAVYPYTETAKNLYSEGVATWVSTADGGHWEKK